MIRGALEWLVEWLWVVFWILIVAAVPFAVFGGLIYAARWAWQIGGAP